MAVSFTISRCRRIGGSVYIRTTTGREIEFNGSMADIREMVKAQFDDSNSEAGLNNAMKLLIAKGLRIDPDLLTPANLEGKTVTYDLTNASILQVS